MAILDPLKLGSGGLLEPTDDAFGLRPKALTTAQMAGGQQAVNNLEAAPTDPLVAMQQAFWDNSAIGGGKIDPRSGDARAKEIAALKKNIQSGLATRSNFEGYTIGNRNTEDIRKDSLTNPSNIARFVSNMELKGIEEQETAARVDAYLEVLKTDGIDQDTQREFLEMYRTGARSVDIAKRLQDFNEGTGVMGNKQANINQQRNLQRTASSRRGVL